MKSNREVVALLQEREERDWQAEGVRMLAYFADLKKANYDRWIQEKPRWIRKRLKELAELLVGVWKMTSPTDRQWDKVIQILEGLIEVDMPPMPKILQAISRGTNSISSVILQAILL